MVYLGGSRHREGTDLEAFAQGMLQSPAETSPNGDFKALGLNMAYERPNDGNHGIILIQTTLLLELKLIIT